MCSRAATHLIANDSGVERFAMDLGLEERVALVTGSSQGIGAAAAVLFGREGARVAVTYHQHRAKAEDVVKEIEHAGGEALAVPLDLAAAESIHAAARTVLDTWGHIDVLVNNAVQWGSRLPWEAPQFEELPPAEWRCSPGRRYGPRCRAPSGRRRGWI